MKNVVVIFIFILIVHYKLDYIFESSFCCLEEIVDWASWRMMGFVLGSFGRMSVVVLFRMNVEGNCIWFIFDVLDSFFEFEDYKNNRHNNFIYL